MIWWNSEAEFQKWALDRLTEQGWHAHPLQEDTLRPGLPDVTAAHPDVGDCWFELKCVQQWRWVYDPLRVVMRASRNLTPQQYAWLYQRHKCGPKCGVLIAFRVGHVEDDRAHKVGQKAQPFPEAELAYITYVPIQHWKKRYNHFTLSSLIMGYNTCRIADFNGVRIVRGGYTPGWAGG